MSNSNDSVSGRTQPLEKEEQVHGEREVLGSDFHLWDMQTEKSSKHLKCDICGKGQDRYNFRNHQYIERLKS